MKLKKWISLFFVAVFVCTTYSGVIVQASATEQNNYGVEYTINTPYEYPIVPGSNEWAGLNSLKEKIEVCAVDESLLEAMTTEALLETVINYPLLINIYAFDTIDEGFASVAEYFPGIEMLLSREDAATCIQAVLEMGSYSIDTENELVRDGFLEALTSYMDAIQNAPRISTPGGSTLEVYYNLTWASHGTTQAKAQANHNRLAAAYPNAVEVSGINPAYNCHSYAWYSTSTSNNCWINNPTPYMTDGSYTRKTSAVVGYKVGWPGTSANPSVPAHSAIVYSVSGGTVKYISKWGYNGVFIHSLSDCPYSGSVSYWN